MKNFIHILGEHPSLEPIVGLVERRDRFAKVPVRGHGHHRPKHLLTRDFHCWRDMREHSRFHHRAHAFAPQKHPRPLRHGFPDPCFHTMGRGRIDQRSDHRRVVARVAGFQPRDL